MTWLAKMGNVFVATSTLLIVGGLLSGVNGHATDLGKFEPGEDYPGGQATTSKSPKHIDVFSQPSRGIGFEGEFKFRIGNSIFRKLWVSSPSSTKSSDGLGPLFNARGCQNCHFKDGRGHPPSANWPDDDAVSMFLRLSIPPQTEQDKRALSEHRVNVISEPTYGGQLQDLSIQGQDAEGRMHITYSEVPVSLSDGAIINLRKPHYAITDQKYGPLHPDTMMSPRVAPQMIGLGLLEAIPATEIEKQADPNDKDHDGISGRPNKVWSTKSKQVELGRFGWKAGAPNVLEQSAGAFLGDMGLSTSVHTNASGECTTTQQACRRAPDGKTPEKTGLEVSDELLDLTVFYAQNLAVPKRRNAKDTVVLRGKALFNKLGCASCHTPSFTTGVLEGQKHLSNQKIWPYTDLLLHDMGEGLADNRPEGVANGNEWRTPPLWGIGLTEVVSGHTNFLHDGRARSITEAILWHEGEAKTSRDQFTQLQAPERAALLKFLNSL